MSMVEDNTNETNVNGGGGDANPDPGGSSGRNTPNNVIPVPKYKEKIQEFRRQTELEQLNRIRAREKLELERERLFVLEGKLSLKPEHMEDPVLRLQFQLDELETKARQIQERKLRRRKRSQVKKNSIKMKWASAKDKLKLKNFVIPKNTTNTGAAGGDTIVNTDLSWKKSTKIYPKITFIPKV